MRLLTKIKLINWHFFTNETIPITGDTLITGDNGAGKSTLIDALQVVMVANLKKVRFNSSAMEDRTTRDIRTYLRGKTGVEGKANYLRNEDFTSYIVLEITRTTTNKPYLIGVVFDYFHTSGEEEHVFFRIDEEPLQDELFFKAPRELRNRGEFLNYLKARDIKHQQYRNDINRYTYDLRQLFGGAKESFFSLFTKGISFSPLTDLRSFVYDYILEEQTLDVESMQEYFEKVRQVEQLIESTKNEIADLERIENRYREIEKLQETLKTNDYMVCRASFASKQEEIAAIELRRTELNARRTELEKLTQEERSKKVKLKETLHHLSEAMRENEARRREEDLKLQLEQLRGKLNELEQREKELIQALRKEEREFKLLEEVLNGMEGPVELTGPLVSGREGWALATESFQTAFPENISWPASAWSEAIDWLRLEKEHWRKRLAELQAEEQRLEALIRNLEQDRVLGHDSPTMKLKAVLEEHLLTEDGKQAPVHVFCEAIDLKDKAWRDAIEGYLHTQKFDLLVPPNCFNEALTIYERHKFSFNLERVGLVNSGRLLQEARSPQKGSLAEEVTATIDYIAAYVNWLLGTVIKCADEQELIQHQSAITAGGMLYQNHTVRQIPKSHYETPFIGREAIRTQLARNREQLAVVQKEKVVLKNKLSLSERIRDLSSDKSDRYRNWNLERQALLERELITEKLGATQAQIMALDFSEYERLKKEYEARNAEVEAVEQRLQELSRDEGSIETELRSLGNQLTILGQKSRDLEQQLKAFAATLSPQLQERCSRKWEKEIQTRKPEVLYANYNSSREGINTKISRQRESLVKERSEYANRYNFPGDPESTNNDAFRERYSLLQESQLHEYETQAREALEKARQSFQEHFIARLGEYIKLADQEIKELNRALKGMRFGTEEYYFNLSAKAETRHYYKMIMDSGVYEGSIFRPAFYEKHGDAINDLFKEITDRDNELIDTVHELTDYRNYLDFDITITDEQGHKSSFSRVARDKSGGETQVPFYVAILASFYQAYQLYRKSDTLRLVVFDEAFNRMDADRIEEAIRFMQKLGFQAIIVAPTGRIQLIIPHMNTNLVVMKENFTSFIERVARKELTEGVVSEKPEV
ncbi:MAG: SbcC/MukB-like Walker B domain-containing protein [Bacillota bacterium]|nr:SbcC/MukB-like Walker B domain-containing protein [Bacillota bacterium]